MKIVLRVRVVRMMERPQLGTKEWIHVISVSSKALKNLNHTNCITPSWSNLNTSALERRRYSFGPT